MNKKIDGIKKIQGAPRAQGALRADNTSDDVSLDTNGEGFVSEKIKNEKKYSRKIVLESIGEGEVKKPKGPLISDIKPATSKTSSVLNSLKKKEFKKVPQKDIADNFIDKKVIADNLKIDEEDALVEQNKNLKKSFDSLNLIKKKKEKRNPDKTKDNILRRQINIKMDEAKEENLSFDDLANYEKKEDDKKQKEEIQKAKEDEATRLKAENEKNKIQADLRLKKQEDKKAEEIRKQKNKKAKKQKNIEGEERAKQERQEKKKRLFEEKEKVKKDKENKRKEREALVKRVKKEKEDAREKRRVDFKNRKQNFVNGIKKFVNLTKTNVCNTVLSVKRRIVKSLILFFSFALIVVVFYLSFFIIVVQFEIDNNVSRSFAKVFPFPAFFVDGGVVDYYAYVDIKTALRDSGLSEAEAEFFSQREVASKLILNSLEKKYGFLIDQDLLAQDIFKNKINGYIMRDYEINTVALKRIKKIDEMIKSGEDFVKVSNKYGDSLGRISLNNKNKDDYTYSDEVMILSNNEISGVVYADNGYYIFKCFGKENDSSDLSYVFIKGVDFDEHFDEAINSFRMMSLVD